MRRAFERAARHYDGAAMLQREVCGELAQTLPDLAPRRILDAGSGTGFGAAPLRRRYPEAQIVGLDIAAGMLLAARDKGEAGPAVCGDIEGLPFAAAAFDLVWSSLAVQWLEDLGRGLAELRRVLAPGGALRLATFGAATLMELREAFRDVDGHTHVHRFASADRLAQAASDAGLCGVGVASRRRVLHYADMHAVMRELKAIGAHNATVGRPTGLTGRRRWQQVADRYEALRYGGTLPATYEILYLEALLP